MINTPFSLQTNWNWYNLGFNCQLHISSFVCYFNWLYHVSLSACCRDIWHYWHLTADMFTSRKNNEQWTQNGLSDNNLQIMLQQRNPAEKQTHTQARTCTPSHANTKQMASSLTILWVTSQKSLWVAIGNYNSNSLKAWPWPTLGYVTRWEHHGLVLPLCLFPSASHRASGPLE